MAGKQESLNMGKKKTKKASGPVECLGLTFESDDARRAYFLELLRQKLADPQFRETPGFPKASDEDILRMSDPPYYTACPNPFLVEVTTRVDAEAQPSLTQLPLSQDFKVDARHPVYLFHPYHTKVPPDIIGTLIRQFTRPGETVLDVFAGSGMTGVAASEAGRTAVLVDLSPVAGFVSATNTLNHPVSDVVRTIERILEESESELGWTYETLEGKRRLHVNYFVRTDVFTCPDCVHEFPFFPHGVIHHGNKVETLKEFPCPSCGAALNVRLVERVLTHEGKKTALCWVNAGRGRDRLMREPTEFDLATEARCAAQGPRQWFPTDAIDPEGYSAKLAQLGAKRISDVSRFLSPRNLAIFADLWARAEAVEDHAVRRIVLATLTSSFTVISERQGYFGGGGGMSGNLYMPIVRMERNPFDSIRRKLNRLKKAEAAKTGTGRVFVSTQSATALHQLPDNSVDYIYTDPPFGANIIYSEMNLILEGWLRIRTNDDPEAVIDESRARGFGEYRDLMRQSFEECLRVLKPGRWMTVEFHNTQASIWNLIQSALGEAGFVVAQVGVLDKGSTTILGDIRPGAAKYDLLITGYKPAAATERHFALNSGTPDAVWRFVDEFLQRIPIHGRVEGGRAQPVAERLPQMLFDRVVAFHVQRGEVVPVSAREFYETLERRYPMRDGMYFTSAQVSAYDAWRATVSELRQLELFVSDEASALNWLRQRLLATPQPYKDIQPAFLKEVRHWSKHETTMELGSLLEDNFLRYDGTGPIPAQILRSVGGGSSRAGREFKDFWYVPDPSEAADLQRVRARALLREFEEYKQSSQRKIKQFRTEAVRAGFKAAYDARDYQTIVEVAAKLPEQVIQEDEKLLMYLDVALMRYEQTEQPALFDGRSP